MRKIFPVCCARGGRLREGRGAKRKQQRSENTTGAPSVKRTSNPLPFHEGSMCVCFLVFTPCVACKSTANKKARAV